MLFDLFGLKQLKQILNRNHGVVIMSLENLKREVAESVAQNAVLRSAINDLRSDVQTVSQQLADAIANGGDTTTFQALADQLDAAQKAAQEVLDQNSVPTPGEPEVPAGEPPTDPATPTTPETPTEPAPVEPTEPPAEQPADQRGQPLV